MTAQTCVTIWHNGSRSVLPVISSREERTIDKNGMKQKGFYDSSLVTLRIPERKGLEIAIGDYVRLGENSGNADRSTDFKVMKIYNNLRGTTPHYRLVCER